MTVTITPLPTPPTRNDPVNFSSRADAFLSALPGMANEVSMAAVEMSDNVNAAADFAATAAASASVTIWISGTTYAIGDQRFSPSNFRTYRRKTAGAGTTDPASDTTNWAPVMPLGMAWQIKTANYTAATADRLMCNTTAGAFTVTLPASPAASAIVTVADYAGKFAVNNVTVSGGATKINGLLDTFICDVNNELRTFEYIDATQGWRVL